MVVALAVASTACQDDRTDKRTSATTADPRSQSETPVDAEQPAGVVAELQAKLKATLGLDAELGNRQTTLKHGVTRFRITLNAYEATLRGGRLKVQGFAEARWVRKSELAEYPLNVTARQLAQLVVKSN